MSENLNAAIAVARQQFNELTKLVSLEELKAFELGSGLKRQRIAALLESLVLFLSRIDHQLTNTTPSDTSVPIARVAAAHIAFYRDLQANHGVILRAHWECRGHREILEGFEDLFDYEPPGSSMSLRSAISWGLERWVGQLDQEELDDWRERGFAIEKALDVVSESWFQPDRWLENMRLLRPLLVDHPVSNIRNHVRERLVEIYRAFTYGLWMSSIALCRSLLEYALKEKAAQLQVETTYIGPHGTREEKSLKHLGEEISTRLPLIEKHIERVRDTGNRILHPKKRDVVALPKVRRDEALKCIESTRLAIERLYLTVE